MGCEVRFYQNNLWEVLRSDRVYFRGTICECFAWIELSDAGYINPSKLKPQLD